MRCECCGARWNMGDNQWIDIKDRLPEEYYWILTGSNKNGAIDYGIRYGNDFFMNGELDKKMTWVTHWMPLPEAPK